MHGPPPPLPNLKPIVEEVRTAEEDVLRRLHHEEMQPEAGRAAAEVVHKIYDLEEELVEDQAHQRELRKERDDAIKWSPDNSDQRSLGERETRRRSRPERRR